MSVRAPFRRLAPCFGFWTALFFAVPLRAQAPDTVLTLTEAAGLLRQLSPEYRAALAGANATGHDTWRAWGSFIPTVTAQASFTQNEFTRNTFLDPTGVSQELDAPLEAGSRTSFQAMSFEWTAFDGGRRFFDLGATGARARAADLAAAATLVRLESGVEVQYFETLKQQELARLSRALLAARRRELEVARARFRIAAVARNDVLQAEIAVGRQELAVLRADQAAEAARRELSAAIGLEEDIAYQVRDAAAIFDPAALHVEGLVGLALGSHPELARRDAEVEAREKSLWAARGTWLPRVSLGLVLSRSENSAAGGDFFRLDPRDTGRDFRLAFTWPLLNGFEKKYQTGRESARLQEAKHNRRAQAIETKKEVRNIYGDLVTAYRAVQIQTQTAELAREAVRVVTERYRIGAASYVELQNATVNATDTERGLIEARYEFMKTFARLQGAVGRPIARPL